MSAVPPNSDHHTVGTASWQNHDSSPPQSVIILHCHVCLGLSNPYIFSAFCGVVTNGWCAYFFRLYALVICDHAPVQRNVEDSDFVSAVPPNSDHHTVGTASWQNHDSSPPQSVIILHCHVCLGLSNPYIFSAFWRQCKSRFTRPRISPSSSGAGGKQWLQMTGALFIAYNALRMKI